MKNYSDVEIAQKLKNWNIGAILLAPFWALGNRVWIGLICWIPWVVLGIYLTVLVSSHYKSMIGILFFMDLRLRSVVPIAYVIVAIVSGKFGNRWAWQNNSWKSFADFSSYQRRWTIAGIFVGIPFTCCTLYIWERIRDWLYWMVNQ